MVNAGQARCRGYARHWFSAPGTVGVRTPICTRYGCDAVNPRPLDEFELREYEAWRSDPHARGAR